jgi:3-dehydroquinate dehydratase-2
MAKILLLNGPNLNLLGQREPDLYGTLTLTQIESQLNDQAQKMGHQLICHQSNAEHELINWIHATNHDATDFILINPGALTHTSIALRDAFLGCNVPFIELHMSNINARESFRQHSFLSDIAVGSLCGFQAHSYELALQAADNLLNKDQ